jgi:hypothetical protein
VTNETKRAKRSVMAPSGAGPMSRGEVLSVEVGADEDVEWIWSHDRKRGSFVTGFKVVPRIAERRSPK